MSEKILLSPVELQKAAELCDTARSVLLFVRLRVDLTNFTDHWRDLYESCGCAINAKRRYVERTLLHAGFSTNRAFWEVSKWVFFRNRNFNNKLLCKQRKHLSSCREIIWNINFTTFPSLWDERAICSKEASKTCWLLQLLLPTFSASSNVAFIIDWRVHWAMTYKEKYLLRDAMIELRHDFWHFIYTTCNLTSRKKAIRGP